MYHALRLYWELSFRILSLFSYYGCVSFLIWQVFCWKMWDFSIIFVWGFNGTGLSCFALFMRLMAVSCFAWLLRPINPFLGIWYFRILVVRRFFIDFSFSYYKKILRRGREWNETNENLYTKKKRKKTSKKKLQFI